MTKGQKIRADRKAEIERVLNEAIAEAQGSEPSEIWQNFPWTSPTDKDLSVFDHSLLSQPCTSDYKLDTITQQ